MDHHLWRTLFDGRPTMMTTPNYPPRRVLDLGCGVRILRFRSTYLTGRRSACGPSMPPASGPTRYLLALISLTCNSLSTASNHTSLVEYLGSTVICKLELYHFIIPDPLMVDDFSLSNKLPFEDDTFDHVHIAHVSKGVPEHKVNSFRFHK